MAYDPAKNKCGSIEDAKLLGLSENFDMFEIVQINNTNTNEVRYEINKIKVIRIENEYGQIKFRAPARYGSMSALGSIDMFYFTEEDALREIENLKNI